MDSWVAIKLYDALTREVRAIVDEQEQPGYYEITVDGSQVASGVYFARLVTTDQFGRIQISAVNKLVLMK